MCCFSRTSCCSSSTGKVTKHKKGEVPSPVQDRAVIAAVHNTRTLRAQYVQTTRTPLQATSPQKALALQLGIALLQLPAGHRCRCRALELPPPPQGTVHSAQGSPLQSHCTGLPLPLQGCTGSLQEGAATVHSATVHGLPYRRLLQLLCSADRGLSLPRWWWSQAPATLHQN